jgi:hypothetical protein
MLHTSKFKVPLPPLFVHEIEIVCCLSLFVCAESVVIMPAFGVQLEIHFWRYA